MLKRILLAGGLAILLSIQAHAADVNAPETNVNVTTSSTAVSTRDTRRLLILQNASDTTIYCKSGGRAAVVGEGIHLNPRGAAGEAGGSVFFDIAVPTGAIHNSTGNKVLVLIEG